MGCGARTPEELDALFEDAFLTRDASGVASLFENGAVLVAGADAHGPDRITQAVAAMWERDYVYVADPRRVVQTQDTALVLARRAISVVRRGRDGAWRYVIVLLTFSDADAAAPPPPIPPGESTPGR